jgi:hypothetical protein
VLTGPQRGWMHVPVQSGSRSKTVQAPSFMLERLSLTGSRSRSTVVGWVWGSRTARSIHWVRSTVLYFLTTPRGPGVVSPLATGDFSCEGVVAASVRVRGCTNGLEDGGYSSRRGVGSMSQPWSGNNGGKFPAVMG